MSLSLSSGFFGDDMKIVLNINFQNKVSNANIELGQSLTIGRSKKAHIQIDDPRISGIHAVIEFIKDGVLIHDQISKNGTFVNNIKIHICQIYIKDIIKLGNTTISINESLSDQTARPVLTFTGFSAERMTKEIKLEEPRQEIKTSQIKLPELNPLMRNILSGNKPRKRMTKKQLKNKYYSRARIAFSIDFILFIGIAYLPFFVLNELKKLQIPLPVSHQTFILILELVIIPIYLISNKRVDFTIGEIMAGLSSLYDKEND